MKLLATCMFAAQAGAQKSPLLSTDLVYNTVELLTDARDFVWEKAKADALLAQGQMHVAKAKQEVLKQTLQNCIAGLMQTQVPNFAGTTHSAHKQMPDFAGLKHNAQSMFHEARATQRYFGL